MASKGRSVRIQVVFHEDAHPELFEYLNAADLKPALLADAIFSNATVGMIYKRQLSLQIRPSRNTAGNRLPSVEIVEQNQQVADQVKDRKLIPVSPKPEPEEVVMPTAAAASTANVRDAASVVHAPQARHEAQTVSGQEPRATEGAGLQRRMVGLAGMLIKRP
jgi:hypothetical protein